LKIESQTSFTKEERIIIIKGDTAMPIYIKIDGLDGNVTAKGHEKWTEISSFQFNVNRSITTKPGAVSDREFTRPSISEIECMKTLDQTSPSLFSESCVGKVKSVKVHVCQTDETISPYMEYTLTNAIVSGYSVTISDQNGRLHPTEKLSFNFEKIEMRFTPYNEKHQAGSPIPAGYDLATAKKM